MSDTDNSILLETNFAVRLEDGLESIVVDITAWAERENL